MNKNNANRQTRVLFLVPALCLAAVAVLLPECSKKPESETAFVATDTLSKTIDTLSETRDTLSASVAFDTLIDKRDGKTYKTVKIGNQIWMAENLNYQPQTCDSWYYNDNDYYWNFGEQACMKENLTYRPPPDTSWCYNDSDFYCDEYGRLYDWETAKTVCPAGWHLPSREEWDSLCHTVGGKRYHIILGDLFDNELLKIKYLPSGRKFFKPYSWENAGKELKTKSGWKWCDNSGCVSLNGTDKYGFSALPGGLRSNNGTFYNIGTLGHWWTATERGADSVYAKYIMYYDVSEDHGSKNHGYSVRCVQDDDAIPPSGKGAADVNP
jgi:uncharacterized protein (TIGR02145 family)